MKILSREESEALLPIRLAFEDKVVKIKRLRELPPVVQFDSNPNLFLLFPTYCNDPLCNCQDLSVLLTKIPKKENENTFSIAFDIDMSTWKEKITKVMDTEYPEYLKVVDEFLHDLDQTGLKEYFRENQKESKSETMKLIKATVPIKELLAGSLYSYQEIYNPRSRVYWNGRRISFSFQYGDRELFVDDLYCLNPDCRCNHAGLVFFSFTKNKKDVEELFVGFYDFKDGFKIEEVMHEEMSASKQIYNSFYQQNPDIGKMLKERYQKMKKMGQKLLDDAQAKERVVKPQNSGEKISRNAPCPCGSGKKYKKCCGMAA